ncbi:MAG: hypothetical protein V1736_04245 [Pseudomonadota bacterium]
MSEQSGLKVLYFPHTFIGEQFLKPLVFFFDEVTVYQPSEWRFSPLHPEVADCRPVRYETPAPAGADLAVLKRTVRDIQSWGDVAASSGQLNYLKHLAHAAVDESQDEILKALKGLDPKAQVDESAAARIFLHLAQEYDQRQDEIRRIAETVSLSEEKLFSDLLVDGQSLELPDSPVLLENHEEDIPFSARLNAWSTLFAGAINEDVTPLATDNSVLDLLPQHELLVQIGLPDFKTHTLSEVLQMQRQVPGSSKLTELKAHLVSAIKNVADSPWMPENAEKKLSGLRQVQAVFETEISHLGTSNLQLALYIFPGVASSEIFKAKQTPEIKNGFAFLLTRPS